MLRAVGCDIGYFLLDEQSDFSPAARLDALKDMLTDDTDIFYRKSKQSDRVSCRQHFHEANNRALQRKAYLCGGR